MDRRRQQRRRGGGFTTGGGTGGRGSDGGSSSSSGSTGSSGGLGDADTQDYEPGMAPADVSPDMRASAEVEHGDMRQIGTEWIWFDKRTNEPFP
jgi:hypothetical protein